MSYLKISISEASFQETAQVLAKAALRGLYMIRSNNTNL